MSSSPLSSPARGAAAAAATSPTTTPPSSSRPVSSSLSSSSSSPPFPATRQVTLARADSGGGGGDDDVAALVDIFWAAFAGPGEWLFPRTPRGRAWLARSFEGFLGRRSYYRPESRVAVVRGGNGKPVAFLLAHIVRPGQNAVGKSWKTRWASCDGDGGDNSVSEARLAGFFEPMAKAHQLVFGGKEEHLFIEFLITEPSHRHRGHASALLAWAARLADELGLPAYLDGGGRGMHICEKEGFQAHVIDAEGRRFGPEREMPCVPMVREARGRGGVEVGG
ncbi:hypothetical protein F4809DRAFT_665732 [Biscogniauxia mediterranea]|nr:hypothetical protein F4809DRAFT_665732 [Biscogniauxia mediterranea]